MDERPLLAKAGPAHLHRHPLHFRRAWCWFLQRRHGLWHAQCTSRLSLLARYRYWVRDIKEPMISLSTNWATVENIRLVVLHVLKALEN